MNRPPKARTAKRHARWVTLVFALLFVAAPRIWCQFTWRFATGGAITGRAAMMGGVVYAPSDDRHLYAIDAATGESLWRAPLGDRPTRSISISHDRTIYLGTRRGTLLAINSAGREVFRFRLGGQMAGDPAVAPDGTVFAADSRGEVYAVSHLGELRFSSVLPTPAANGPAIGVNGIVVVGGTDANLYAIDPTGNRLWNAVLAGVPTEIAIYEGRRGYVGTSYGTIVAFEVSSGRILWDHIMASEALAPLLYEDAILYATVDGAVGRLGSDGELHWVFETGLHLVEVVMVDDLGSLLVRDRTNKLTRIGEAGAIGDPISIAPGTTGVVAGAEGLLVGGAEDWLTYGYRTSAVPAEGWTQVGRDGRHNAVSIPRGGGVELSSEELDAASLYLETLMRIGGIETKQLAIGEIEERIVSGAHSAKYLQIRDSLRRLASDGVLSLPSVSGSQPPRANPSLRISAARLLPFVAGTGTNIFLATLIRSDPDRHAVAQYMRSIGRTGSDASGHATRTIAHYVLADIARGGSPDAGIGLAALTAIEGVLRYHGALPDVIAVELLVEMFRADYPRVVKEGALDAIRSIGYYPCTGGESR